MREKTHPSGRNKSTNTTPPPPSQSTEISSVDIEESNTTCWEKCCSCCTSRKKTNKMPALTDTDIAALMGQYEYVVEKLHIVKAPLLLCGTEEDMNERINKLKAANMKINTRKSLLKEDWECLPFKKPFHPVYFVQDDTHPSVTEIFSRGNESNTNPDGEFTSTNVSTEIVARVPTVETHFSKETVASHRFAMIPADREPTPQKKETVTVQFTLSDDENTNEIEEKIWPKPEYIVGNIQSETPQRSRRSSRDSAKYDYPQTTRSYQPTDSDRQEYYDEYRSTYRRSDPAPVHDLTLRSSHHAYIPAPSSTPPPQVEANRPSRTRRREATTDQQRLPQKESPIVRPIPPPSRPLPSTSRAPPPSSSEPRPSTSRDQYSTQPPKGPVSQIKSIVLSSSTSSEVVSILSSKPSIKSTPLSKDSDVLIEEGKPRITEDTSQKKMYVDVSGRHLPKSEVHKILNKYSSIFIENLKDPIPKDPLTLPKDDTASPQRRTSNPPTVLQSSRGPVVAEATSQRPKHRMDQPPTQVTARTEPSQSVRSQKLPSARARSASGASAEPAEPAKYDASPPRSAATFKRTSGYSRQRDGEPSTFRDATEIRKSLVQQQGFEERPPKFNYTGEHSYARKRKTSKDERMFENEDDVSVEMGCHEPTNEYNRDSVEDFHEFGRGPRTSCTHSSGQRLSIYHVNAQNDPLLTLPLSTASALPPQEAVPVHPPCCKEQTDKEHILHLNTGENQCPHPCPRHPDERERICTAEHEDSESDLQNTNVIKHWKIIIKQHKNTENDSSAGESD